MPASFEWEFEEEEESRRDPSADAGPPGGRRWRRRAAIAALLLLLIGAGVRTWWVGYQRALAEIRANLRAAVTLELRTIADRDVELFRTRQDPDDAEWRERQVARFVSDASDRFAPAPGLEPADRAPEIRELRLVGRTARVALTLWYQGRSDTRAMVLPFHVIWSYRQADDGTWYHVAPLDGEWQEPYATSVGVRTVELGGREQLVIGFTATDEQNAGRLTDFDAGRFRVAAAEPGSDYLLGIQGTQAEADLLEPVSDELGRLVVRSCGWLGCAADARYNLSFEDVPGPTLQGDRWRLPSLYLAGRPGSEAARAAWERALKLWLVAALAQTEVGDGALTRSLLYEQWLTRIQAAQGLAEPPAPNVPLLARAVAAGEQLTLPELWVVRRNATAPQESRLREAEMAAFMDLLTQRAGRERLLGIMALLRESLQGASLDQIAPEPVEGLRTADPLEGHPERLRAQRLEPSEGLRPEFGEGNSIDRALVALVGQDAAGFADSWYAYLAGLTGQRIIPFSTFVPVEPVRQPVPSPPGLLPSPAPPGDQIALVCDSRVWVGNADGSDLFPITRAGHWFYDVEWSPDGDWLLARWVYSRDDSRVALYYLAADGSHGHVLTHDSLTEPGQRRLSPDGRYVAYDVGSEVRGVEVETGEARRLPGLPLWSPKGDRMIYVGEQQSRPWLANADWGNPQPISSRRGLRWGEAIWSPDGTRLVMPTNEGRPYDSNAVVYDLQSQRITAYFDLSDLTVGFLDQTETYLTTGDPYVPLELRSRRQVWPVGWSADSRRLLLWGQWTAGDLGTIDVTLLKALPLGSLGAVDTTDPSAPDTVVYGVETFLNNVAWSPTDPDRLILKWRPEGVEAFAYETVLFDLEAGPAYRAKQVRQATWSPDGAWVGLVGNEAITILDKMGQERFRFDAPGTCREMAWNPTADLRELDTAGVAASD